MSLNLEGKKTNGVSIELEDDSQEQYHKDIVPFPYEINKIDEKLNLQLLEDHAGIRSGYVQVGPKKWFLPSSYAQNAEYLYNFELRPDDVFVLGFPRSGTTLTQETVWLLGNNLDFKQAADKRLHTRSKFLEFSCFIDKDTQGSFLKENVGSPDHYTKINEMGSPVWNKLSNSKGQRFIKSHLPFSLLPPNLTQVGCKMIYIARDPKDVAVSFYHYSRKNRMHGFLRDFRKFWYYFSHNIQLYTPILEHIKEGWSKRHEENVLFIFYENFNKNRRQSIEEISNFLGKSYSVHELDKLEHHLKFENFKRNASVNEQFMVDLGICLKNEEPFIRKGKVGGWKDYFDADMETEANEWIEEGLKDTDLRFPE